MAASDFPAPLTARRIPFTFTLDSLVIEGGQFYLPDPITHTLPTIFIIYPSPAINWSNVSAAMAAEGFAVVAVGPTPARGLDIEGHVRDFRAVFQAWQVGRFDEMAPGAALDHDRWLLMSGSFGSLMLFRSLRDLPAPLAILGVGGISDAFLGIQSLYSTELKIPPPYDNYVAALGRPGRDPAFFFGYSPLAAHLPDSLLRRRNHPLQPDHHPQHRARCSAGAARNPALSRHHPLPGRLQPDRVHLPRLPPRHGLRRRAHRSALSRLLDSECRDESLPPIFPGVLTQGDFNPLPTTGSPWRRSSAPVVSVGGSGVGGSVGVSGGAGVSVGSAGDRS